MSEPERVTYRRAGSLAAITLDDGKVNAMSTVMLEAINNAFDRAAADDAAVVVLAGREGVFSAGFDLPTLRRGGFGALTMVRAGFETAERILSFPKPVVVACTGHAIAMGTFLLFSGDYRIGTRGTFTLSANEVAIGLTMPRAAMEILRYRLTPSAFTRAVNLAEPFTPDDAAAAGFLDRVVGPAELLPAAYAVADQLTGLDMDAHRATKLRARARMLDTLRSAIDEDTALMRARLAS